jgi:putative Mg2+ transporter-C (MgtC) family protein
LQGEEKTNMTPDESAQMSVLDILLRLAVSALIGGVIGYERRIHHKAIGVAGMILVGIGSCSYMLLAKHLSNTDPAAISRAIQGIMQGIGFLGGAVIFKGGADVRGIKTAAAIWITGAIGMAIATWFHWLGIIVGAVTFAVLFIADRFYPRDEEEVEQGPPHDYGPLEKS